MLNSIDRKLHLVEKAMLVGSIGATLFLTLLIVVDVFLRYVFNSPLPATWEMSELGMPYIVFLAFAFTLSIDGHVRVSLFTIRLPSGAQRACEIFTNAVCFLTCAVFAYASWLRFWESFLMREEILAAIKLPWYVGKFAMPIGMAMFSLRYLLRLINNFANR